jgi:type I restriction enzyme S subunit
MEEVWKEYKTQKLGDYILDIAAGPFGSNLKVECFVPSGFPIIDGANLRGFKVTDNVTKFVTEEKARSLYRSIAKRNDVVVTISGNVGQISYIPYNSKYKEYLVSQRQFRATFDTTKVYVPYLIYYFHTIEGQHKILSFANQTGVPALAQPLKNFKNIDVQLPPLSKQKQIASILSSLDEKIEYNKRINDNLEQQAQALFKSWFVDFEPFKDEEFVESVMGMIPKGWKVGKLGELCQFKRGKNLLSKDAIDRGVPVVAGGLEPSCYHNVSNTKSPVVTVSGSGANAGYMRMYHQEVWASDCSFIDSTCENLLFVYCFLAANKKLLRHAQTGAVQPHVKPADIHDFDIVIPPSDTIKKFQKTIVSSIKKKGEIEQESHRLAQLRDTLLPRLMSGELKVNEITELH